MSKIKLRKLHQDSIELQNLSSEDCQNITGGMNGLDTGNTNSIICRYYPNLPYCDIDPGTTAPAKPYP